MQTGYPPPQSTLKQQKSTSKRSVRCSASCRKRSASSGVSDHRGRLGWKKRFKKTTWFHHLMWKNPWFHHLMWMSSLKTPLLLLHLAVMADISYEKMGSLLIVLKIGGSCKFYQSILQIWDWSWSERNCWIKTMSLDLSWRNWENGTLRPMQRKKNGEHNYYNRDYSKNVDRKTDNFYDWKKWIPLWWVNVKILGGSGPWLPTSTLGIESKK